MAHTQIVLESEREVACVNSQKIKIQKKERNRWDIWQRQWENGTLYVLWRCYRVLPELKQNKLHWMCLHKLYTYMYAYVCYTQMHAAIRECFSWFLGMYCSLNSRRHKGLYFCFNQTYSPLHTNWILWVCMPFHMHVCARARWCVCVCARVSVCARASHALTTYLMYTSTHIEVHVCT